MGVKVLTVKVSDETLRRLRSRYAAETDTQVAEKALAACADEDELEKLAVHGWDALDQLVGLVHGDGS
ncbi:MAG: hypothetical protein ACM3VW_08795, partial [Bacteroidota bacterium]